MGNGMCPFSPELIGTEVGGRPESLSQEEAQIATGSERGSEFV